MKKIKVDPSKRILMDIESRNSRKKQKLCSSDNSQDKINESEHSISDLIVKPHEHDVLCGRGNFANYHDGNSRFRELVKNYKIDYVSCAKSQKKGFSQLIYNKIRELDPPGRFLKYDVHSNIWTDIGEKRALEKIRQALREGAPDIMKVLSPELRAAEMMLDFKRQANAERIQLEYANKNEKSNCASPPNAGSSSKDMKTQSELSVDTDIYDQEASTALSNSNVAVVHNDEKSSETESPAREQKAESLGPSYHDQYDYYEKPIRDNRIVTLKQEKIIASKFSDVDKKKRNFVLNKTAEISEADSKKVASIFCTKYFANAAIAGPKIVPTRYF